MKTNTPMKKLSILSVLLLMFAFTACDDGGKGESDGQDSTADSSSAINISVTPLEPASPEFADAELSLKKIKVNETYPNEHTFLFNVENYTLGDQTSDAEGKGLNNSKDGQHIHIILTKEGENDQPYMAHYTPEAEASLEDGNYMMTAFLSRSYHESVKSEGASFVTQFSVGDGADVQAFDLEAPTIIYSRPKGTYSGDDAKRVLLDWFLVNCELGVDYMVKANIKGDGYDQDFEFDNWQPYVIEGLPAGKCTIILTLMQGDNEIRTVNREITVNP